MKLNDIDLESYAERENEVAFVMPGTVDLDDVMALDGEALTITSNGSEYRKYEGYSLMSAGYTDQSAEHVSARFFRKLSDQTESAINQLDANVATIQAAAESAQQTAQAAMETAQEAGASPAVKAASAMYVNATALTNTQLTDVRELIEDFVPGAEYEKGWIRRYDGAYYRMAQKIDSTTSTTYQPGEGTESLYTLIDLAADGIRVWHAPTDATNSFALGEKAHYPDADGAVYVSKRDGNTSEPGKDEWWELDQIEDK